MRRTIQTYITPSSNLFGAKIIGAPPRDQEPKDDNKI
jgi:hypothetical protein